MKISGLPTIKYDECLMSWLVRSASSIGEDSVLEYANSLEDPDFDLTNKNVLGFLSELGMGEEIARGCFGARTTWLLPWENRAAYCLLCLQEDISVGGSPYWRKTWCYLHCPICVKHRRLLVVADPISIGLQKSWVVFIEECNGRYNRSTKCRVSWKQPSAPDGVTMLALRVQGFLTRAHISNFVRLPGIDVAVSGEAVLAVTRLLLESFLFPRLRRSLGDGVARAMQTGFPRTNGIASIEQARQLGCSDGHVYSRMTALILVGCVFKLFPAARFNDVRNSLGLTADVCSGEAYDIGRNGMRLSSATEYIMIIEFLNGLPDGLKVCLGEFIEGLKNSRAVAVLS